MRRNALALGLATLALALGLALAGPSLGQPARGPMGPGGGGMGMGPGGMMMGQGMGGSGCPMLAPEGSIEVKELENGASITITSKDPAVVRRIQKRAQIMRLVQELRQEEGAAQ